MPDAKVTRPWANPIYMRYLLAITSPNGSLTNIGDSAGPKTSLCLGSRPTPKAMKIKANEVIVSSA
jgi:hypothetical protein